MPKHSKPQDPGLLAPPVLTPKDEVARKIEKRKKELENEEKLKNQELTFNNILGPLLQQWRPGGRTLILRYQRQSVSIDSKSALTASNMTQSALSTHFGWKFQRFHPVPDHVAVPRRGHDSMIESKLAETLVAIMPLPNEKTPLPSSLRFISVDDFEIDSSDKDIGILAQLRQISNAVYLLFGEGKIDDAATPDKKLARCLIDWYKEPEDPLTTHYKPGLGEQPSVNEQALAILLNLSHEELATSELAVERTIGSFLQCIFAGIGPKGSTTTTSGKELRMFGPFTAFGSHPLPDLLSRAKSMHPLLNPVCLVAEGKTFETYGPDAITQLATAAHSTLALFVFAWFVERGRYSEDASSNDPFPSWAHIYGILYTDCLVEVYAFYPCDGVTGSQSRDGVWNFKASRLCSFENIMRGSLKDRLDFMHTFLVIQNQAMIFGSHMDKLLSTVFEVKSSQGAPELQFRTGLLENHELQDRTKLQKIFRAFTQSLKEVEKLANINFTSYCKEVPLMPLPTR